LTAWPDENRVRQMFGLAGQSEMRVSAGRHNNRHSPLSRIKRKASTNARRPAKKHRLMRETGDEDCGFGIADLGLRIGL
jgi:hypothetical protein